MKVLGICGSLRKDSWNLKLLRNMLEKTAGKGVETKLFDLNCVSMFQPERKRCATPFKRRTQ
jgi:multimeric flavodoxin WrbA